MCYATCPEVFVHFLPVKRRHQPELPGLETPHPGILPGQLPALTHSVSCYGAEWTPSTFGPPKAKLPVQGTAGIRGRHQHTTPLVTDTFQDTQGKVLIA